MQWKLPLISSSIYWISFHWCLGKGILNWCNQSSNVNQALHLVLPSSLSNFYLSRFISFSFYHFLPFSSFLPLFIIASLPIRGDESLLIRLLALSSYRTNLHRISKKIIYCKEYFWLNGLSFITMMEFFHILVISSDVTFKSMHQSVIDQI